MLFEVNNTPESLNALERKIRLQYDQLRSNIDLKDFDLRYKGYNVIVDVDNLNKIIFKLQAQLTNSTIFNTVINKNMSTIERSSTPPPETITAIDISEAQNKTILTWYDAASTTQYFYTEAKVIKAPIDCTGLFQNCINLTECSGFFNIIDTINTTSMKNMFKGCSSMRQFMPNTDYFNTKNVVTMSGMFSGCDTFNDERMHTWNVQNLEDISYIYENCTRKSVFNIGDWNAPKLKNMRAMCIGCTGFVNIYNNLSTSHVTDMREMFKNCVNLTTVRWGSNFVNTSLTGLDTLGETNSTYMMLKDSKAEGPSWSGGAWNSDGTFRYYVETTITTGSLFNQAINKTAVMFKRSTTLPSSITTTDISAASDRSIVTWFDTTSKVQYWHSNSSPIYVNPESSLMFQNCSAMTTIDLSHFDTSKTIYMNQMFENCSSLTSVNVLSFDTTNVVTIAGMFKGCSSLLSLNLSNFNTQNMVYLNQTFEDCTKMTSLNISGWILPNADNLAGLFSNCIALTTLDVSRWNTSKVTTMMHTFKNCRSITTLSLSSWNTLKVTDMREMFSSCVKLTRITYGSNFVNTALPGLDSDTHTNAALSMLLQCPANKPNWSEGSWYDNGTFVKVPELKDGDMVNASFDTTAISFIKSASAPAASITTTDISQANNRSIVTWFDAPNKVQYWYTPYQKVRCRSTRLMFVNMEALTSLDLSAFDTSNTTDMGTMFGLCANLTSINLSSFDTSNVTDMSIMFGDCRKLISLDLTHFDTSNVTNMHGMFSNCYLLSNLQISNFSTSTVFDMSNMFGLCRSLSTLDLTSFSTYQVSTMNHMFVNCAMISNIIYGTDFVNSHIQNPNVDTMENGTYWMYKDAPQMKKPNWTNGTWTSEGTFIQN